MKIEEAKELLNKVDQLIPHMSTEGAQKVKSILGIARMALARCESYGIDLEDRPELVEAVQVINDLYMQHAAN